MLSTDCHLSGYVYIAKQCVLLYTHMHTPLSHHSTTWNLDTKQVTIL